ncbi:MAG: AAA family ATPase [Candidatus Sumerlaeota bacterium]|nr:AAA family ATPase [Candidatus Sumerlaeota bacterium]
MKTIVFFNNKGGVGKTSLVYHLSWMYADLGISVVACDLDPQANLSAMCLDEDRFEELWPEGEHRQTILGCIQPILDGTGDIASPHVEELDDNLALIVGDLGLSLYEDRLSDAWPRCHDGDQAAFRATSAFYRIMLQAAEAREAELVLIDIGPNLGAINRAVLIAGEHVVVPLTPDLFSIQGLKNLGPTFRRWSLEWSDRLKRRPEGLPLPQGTMHPAGYVIHQHRIRLSRPTKAFDRWVSRIPGVYRRFVLDEEPVSLLPGTQDPFCLSLIKHYQSLMPMAMEARKPIFKLLPADGAIGAHMDAVLSCRKDFEDLARRIAQTCGIPLP